MVARWSSRIALLALLEVLAFLLVSPSRSFEAAVPQAASETAKLADKTLKDYDKSCMRSGCHARIQDFAWTHGPVAVGACDACHLLPEMAAPEIAPETASVSEHRFVLRKNGNSGCGFCHAPPPAQAFPHQPFGDANCKSCHGVHGGQTSMLLKEENVSRLCDSCHNDKPDPETGKVIKGIQAEMAAGTFKHGPVADGDCAACHDAHSASHPRLLPGNHPTDFYAEYTDSTYDFCFKCHDSRLATEETTTATAFRDGDRNLHHIHVHKSKGRTCKACHFVHAGKEEKLLRDTVRFGPGSWPLPIDFQRSPTGGSCATGCHKAKAYDNSHPQGPPLLPVPKKIPGAGQGHSWQQPPAPRTEAH